MQKTPIVGVPGIGLCSVLPFRRSDGLFTKTLGKTICVGSLEFTTDRFGRLSLSPEGDNSGVIFVGMVNSGLPSLHIALKELSDEGDATPGKGGGSSELPDPRGCNVVTLIVPMTTTSPSENTSALLTVLMVPLRTAAPQPGTELLPEQQQAY
jgi:hypothetical protein